MFSSPRSHPQSQSQSKSKRASTPKSRNGCLTCKARRVKCDETRPVCNACAGKSSRACVWPFKRDLQRRSERWLLPHSASQLTQVQPTQALQFINEQEAHYFRVYQEQIAPELSGHRRSSAWTTAMLCQTHTDSFMLRGLVAVGALAKYSKTAYAASREPQLALRDAHQARANQHREFALAAYAKSIEGMRQIVPTADRTTSLRSGLLACLLVNLMESYLEDLNTAYMQAQAGYDLLHEWIHQYQHDGAGLGSPKPGLIEDEIFTEFARQDLHGAMWWGVKPLERSQIRRREGQATVEKMPAKFSSLEEARRYKDLILRRTYHLINEAMARIIAVKVDSGHAQTADSPGELIDPCHVPEVLLGERDMYLGDIRRFRKSFKPLFDDLIASSDPDLRINAALLQIHSLDAEIALAGTFFTEECAYDVYHPEFEEIITLCRLVRQSIEKKSSRVEPVFDLSMGTEKALYTLAFACREKSLRTEALRLLRFLAPLDASKYLCRMFVRAEWIVGLEEEGRDGNGHIPESARYKLVWSLNHWFEKSRDLTMLAFRRVGYPLGRAYPARRVWKLRTLTQIEVESMVDAEATECTLETGRKIEEKSTQSIMRKTLAITWPSTVRKPNCVKWEELHGTLLQTVPKYAPD